MLIVKIGGGKGVNAEGAIKDLAELDEKFIIVHGANEYRDEIAKKMGKPKKVVKSISGYSSVFSDQDAIDVLMMAYSGLRNKRIVEMCQKHGINAVGLSGVDGKAVVGKRNKGIRIRKSEKKFILRDFSGKPKEVNKELLELLMENGYVPVLCVPIIDEENFAINAENDNILRVLHKAFRAEKIIQLIDAPGFLEDPDDPKSLVAEMSRDELEKKERQVDGRMKRKILSLRKLFMESPTEVIFGDGRTENPVKDALAGRGTVIR